MSEISDKLVTMVTNAGNSMTYPALYAAVAVEERRLLPNALKEAKKAGLLTEEVKLVDGVVIHTLIKV